MSEIEKKYVTVVKEDAVSIEKFPNGNLSSATELDDYISSNVAGGDGMKIPELFEKTDKTGLDSGSNVPKDNLYFEPGADFLTSLAGLAWLMQTTGVSLFDDDGVTSIADMDSGDKLYISLNDKENKSFTMYSSITYTNSIVYARGCQINEISLPLESGDVSVATSTFASRMLLDETNLERGLSKWLKEKIRYRNLKDISLANFTDNNGVITVPSSSGAWTSVGCDVNSANFEGNFDLNEDTGFGFCNDGWSDGFECGTLDIKADVEVTQKTNTWAKLAFGGYEFDGGTQKSVKYHLDDGKWALDIILPLATIQVDGGEFRIDNPTETVNFSNETADVSYEGNEFPDSEGLIVLTKL